MPSEKDTPQQSKIKSEKIVPFSERTHEKINFPNGWADEHNYIIQTIGFPPEDKKSESLKSLMACENARNRSLRIFQEMSPGLKVKYSSTEQEGDFILITTLYKENDTANVCRIVVQFFSPYLKKRIEKLGSSP